MSIEVVMAVEISERSAIAGCLQENYTVEEKWQEAMLLQAG